MDISPSVQCTTLTGTYSRQGGTFDYIPFCNDPVVRD